MSIHNFIPDKFLLSWQIRKAKNAPILLKENEKRNLDDIVKRNPNNILFAGYPKSGNTWLRFLIYHYFYLKNGGEEKVLTYEDLNTLQFDSTANGIGSLIKNYPPMVRTHLPYMKEFVSIFSKIIYVHRNPLDCLVSAWHFFIVNRNKVTKSSPTNSIDNYVKYNYTHWFRNFSSYYHSGKNTVFISFEDLKNDPIKELTKVLIFIDEIIDQNLLEKSVELSNFSSIRKMTIDSGQTYGSGPKGIKGIFAGKEKLEVLSVNCRLILFNMF